MQELLKKCIKHYWHETLLAKCQTNKERAEVLANHFGGYGGDSTIQLITHYGNTLEAEILKVLELSNS